MIKLFDTYYSPAPGEPAAAHEGAFFALPDDQLAAFAFVALNTGRLCGRLRRQHIAFLVQLESGFTFGIVAASKERPEPAVLMHHRLAALRTFMLA